MFDRERRAPVSGAMARGVFFLVFLFLNLAAGFSPARGDTIMTVFGEIVHGINLQLTKGKVSVESKALGTVDIDVKQVRSIATSKPVDIFFTNDARLRGRIVGAGEGIMRVLFSSGVESTPFSLDSVRSITPPSPTIRPQEWKTEGNINLGVTSSTGNTEAQLFHADGQITARRAKNRYNARGEVNFRRENDQELTNDALLKLKHDYFFSKKWFFYTGIGFEHDTAKDLNLRTDIGTGTGYQVIDTARTAISLEGGPSYVIEDYSDGSDQSYAALRWAADMRYDPILMKLTLFHHHEVLAALTARGGTVAKSRTGARYNLGSGLTATGQVRLDWDSDPGAGEEETDIIYMVTLGYAW